MVAARFARVLVRFLVRVFVRVFVLVAVRVAVRIPVQNIAHSPALGTLGIPRRVATLGRGAGLSRPGLGLEWRGGAECPMLLCHLSKDQPRR